MDRSEKLPETRAPPPPPPPPPKNPPVYFFCAADIYLFTLALMRVMPPRPARDLAPTDIITELRNLMQNAVDFAATTSLGRSQLGPNTVISIRIFDDGARFPPDILGRIENPFMRRRRSDRTLRSGPNMRAWGWGCFIAKNAAGTIWRRAALCNAAETAPRTETHVGAVVKVTWPRGEDRLRRTTGDTRALRGKNTPVFVVKPYANNRGVSDLLCMSNLAHAS